jgi:hypothetical protein
MIEFNDKLESDKIFQLLSRVTPYYCKAWQDIDRNTGLFGVVEPRAFNMRKIGSSSPVIEYVVRPHVQILCIIAAHVHNNYFPENSPLTREKAIDMLRKGIQWTCDTHLTGTTDVEQFLERKRWGENWRSSIWASMLGMAAYFSKSVIGDSLYEQAAAVLAFEADRFTGVFPPSGCEVDTKLDENAQDAMLLAWAVNMNPHHPHCTLWEKSMCRWAINIATSINDAADHAEYCESSVSRWVTTRTLFPDMTAENHGFFHPQILSYAGWVVLAMAAYSLNNREEPVFFRRKNHQDTFEVLLRFCLPSGMIYEPGANDLPIFLPRPFALAWGLWNNDPRAILLTARLLGWLDGITTKQESSADTVWIPGLGPNYEGWELFFQSQVGFELAMLSILPFPKKSMFYSSGQIEGAVDTRQIFPFVEICYRRNTRTTRSVAWKALGKHPVIGLNVHAYPELLMPSRAAMLGIPSITPAIKHWDVIFHNDRVQRDGFDTYGRIVYFGVSNEELMSRETRVLTWGDEGLIILDRIKACADVGFEEQFLSPVYIVNDVWTGNHINLFSGSLREAIVSSTTSTRNLSCPSFWASVESLFLFQFVWARSKGLFFIPGNQKNSPRYWKNCRLDTLAVQAEAKQCSAGDTLYEVGFYIGAGKGPRPFKCTGTAGDYFKGLVIMDGKNTVGLN